VAVVTYRNGADRGSINFLGSVVRAAIGSDGPRKDSLTPEIESILNVEKFHARQLRSLLRLLRSEFGITLSLYRLCWVSEFEFGELPNA